MLQIKPDENSSFFFLHDENQISAKHSISRPHYHPNFEIYFITKGNVTYFIDDKVYNVRAGDIVIIPDGVIHHTEYENGIRSRLLINCSHRYIPASVRTEISSLLYLYRNPNVSDEILEIFKKIEKEYNSPDHISDNVIMLYTHLLFYVMERNRGSCIDVEDHKRYTGEAVRYLKNNFTKKITLAQTAKVLSMSPEHLSRSFKKENGIGFNKYVNLLRLQKAEELLKITDKSISEIAEDCGFEDSNYFSLKFKELYGIPPKALRRSKVISEI